MRPITLTRSLVTGVVGAICASQTTGGAGALNINGTLAAATTGGIYIGGSPVSGAGANMAAQQQIGLTSAGNDSAVNFTITGTDDAGRTISEVLAGPNANTVKSFLNYRTVTSIVASAAVGIAMTVDTVTSGASIEVPLDRLLNPTSVSLIAELTAGAANVTVQSTSDDVYAGNPNALTWQTVTAMNNLSATTAGSLTVPATAVRLLTNSGTGTFVLRVLQSGQLS